MEFATSHIDPEAPLQDVYINVDDDGMQQGKVSAAFVHDAGPFYDHTVSIYENGDADVDCKAYIAAPNAPDGPEYHALCSYSITEVVASRLRAILINGGVDETESMRVAVALEEALKNAHEHGNMDMTSEVRGNKGARLHHISSLSEDILRRFVTMHVTIKRIRNSMEICINIKDEGKGFDPHQLPDPTDPANLEGESGRGVFLMRSFMHVDFNDEGNEVTMTKTLNC